MQQNKNNKKKKIQQQLLLQKHVINKTRPTSIKSFLHRNDSIVVRMAQNNPGETEETYTMDTRHRPGGALSM